MLKVLSILLLLFIVSVNKSFAQEFHISIEPTVIQIDATPPAEFQAPFRITNLSNTSITLTPLLIPIESEDDGQVRLNLKAEENLSTVIRDRISIIDGNESVTKITLRPGEAKNLILFMNLKEGDPVGDYYFSVVFNSEGRNIEDSSSSSIPAGIGMNVLVSLGPKVSPTAEIVDFSTSKILTSGPVFFSLKLKNTGKHLIQPEGSVRIKNMFGKEVAKLKILPQYILANSERFLIDEAQASPSAQLSEIMSKNKNGFPSIAWDEKFLLGFYTATVELKLEENGPEVGQDFVFFAIPLQVIAIISGLIFVILGIFLRINLRIKRSIKS